MLQVGAGTGLLYLLRWFWWRVNAWCEIVAMVSSFAISVCASSCCTGTAIELGTARGIADDDRLHHRLLGRRRPSSARRPTARR